jgi:hypothetical protein
VLIDADNTQPGIIEGLLAEVAKYGTAHVKRAPTATGRGMSLRLEGPAARPVDPADPAVRLHHRQERY